jgi:hypothetical protein
VRSWTSRRALAAARGVAYIHRAGSSHSNIKSPNIVVTPSRARRRRQHPPPRRCSVTPATAYSFGVVVLELLSGIAPAPADGGVDLPRWVRSVVQEWTSEVFDSTIAGDARIEDEMMRLGVECTEQRSDRRPGMADVEERIERIVEDACRKAEFGSTDGSRSVSA